MSVGGGRVEHGAEQAAQTGASAAQTEGKQGGGTARVQRLLGNGRPSPEAVAAVVADHPGERDAIVMMCMQAFGNSFVQHVIKATIQPNQQAEPLSVASKGIEAADEPLPHQAAIQASFGKHDISHVKTQTGGAAAVASQGLGASAFATGSKVGFAQSPDLHTAAHEAAHVVQQQAGVQLKGGIDGGGGDPHEQHADAVADIVVRGESAEGLLDAMGPKTGSAKSDAPVQRKGTTIQHQAGFVSARRYLEDNHNQAFGAIESHLVSVGMPDPAPRLSFRRGGEAKFLAELFIQMAGTLKFSHPIDFVQMVFPADPYGLVDQMRPMTKAIEGKGSDPTLLEGGAVGLDTWVAPLGVALAQLVEAAVVSSLKRLGPRYLELRDKAGDTGTVHADDIVRSHPMDRRVVHAMCVDGVFDVTPAAASKSKKQPDKGLNPKRKIELTWLGGQDKQLWNWVRANPTDATVEEVSTEIFKHKTADNDGDVDYYAAFLTAAPPLFGIPPQWAKTLDETQHWLPAKIIESDGEADHQLATLSASPTVDDAALGEAGAPVAKPKGPPDPAESHEALLADTISQANYLKTTLGAWKLGDVVDRSLQFLHRRQADGKNGAQWVPVLKAQKETLSSIGSGIVQLDQAAKTLGVPTSGPESKPLFDIMHLYADAAAVSQLKLTSNRLVQKAANAQSMLSVQGLRGSVQDMDTSVDMLRQSAGPGDYTANKYSGQAVQLDAESVAMQTSVMRGGKVDQEKLDDLTIRSEELALEAKFEAVEDQLQALESSASEAGDGIAAWFAARFSSDFRSLHDATQTMRDDLQESRDRWHKANETSDMPQEGVDSDVQLTAQIKRIRRQALSSSKADFAAMSKDDRIGKFLREGASLVKWQGFRTACVRLAAMIGVSLVGGMIGGMVARGVAGMMLEGGGAAAMESLSVGGQVIAKGAGLVTETAVQSAGQTVIFGDKFGPAFLENMIMSLGSMGALKIIESDAKSIAQAEKTAAGMWEKAKAGGSFVLRESSALAGHTIMGIAMGYVAHKIVTGEGQPPPATLEDWMIQGAGIAIGRYVGKAMEHRHAQMKKLASIKEFPAGQKLLKNATELAEMSKRVEGNPQAKDAMELLGRRHQVLSDELAALDELEKSPEKMKAANLDKDGVEQIKGSVHDQLAEVHGQGFAEVPLHLSGMQELIPGALWSGTPEQIGEAVHQAKAAGINITAAKEAGTNKWHLRVEGRDLIVEERTSGFGKSATKTGGGAQSDPAGQKPVRELENAPAISARATVKLQALAPPERAQVEEIFARAENHGQHTLLERALAAGHSVHELDSLRAAMRGMSTEQVVKTFTGVGVLQYYQQSCVPASYQIAIAEVDPYYAFELRNNREMVMQEQRDVLIEKGATQTKRTDVRKGRPVEHMGEQLADESMGKRLHDPAQYSPEDAKGDDKGVETTEMSGTAMHDHLEKATGSQYEVITDDRVAYARAGQGKYQGGSPPHEAIAAAVAAGKPVIIATKLGDTSHAQVIVSRSMSATGEVMYQILDPYSGKISDFPEKALDWFGAHSVTLPKEFAETAKLPATTHVSDPVGVKSGGPGGDVHGAAKFLQDLRTSNARTADILTNEGYTPEMLGSPNILTFLRSGSPGLKAEQMRGFVGKTKLSRAEALPLFDQLLELHPEINGASLKEFGNELGAMVSMKKLSCSHPEAIRTAIDLSAFPRYADRPSAAVSEIRGLLGDNISPEVALSELTRETASIGEVTHVDIAGAGALGPDVKMQTSMGKRVGREMQTVGPSVSTPIDSAPDVARANLESSLMKGIRDKALDYMREGVASYDSQEIIIQIKASQQGYNYDHLLEDPALFDRVMERVYLNPDYTKGLMKAEARVAARAANQPAIKRPDRVVVYNSTGKVVYEK